jgi:DnaD/phage-associated family protein
MTNWIKLDATIKYNYKVNCLSETLNVPHYAAVGLLAELWTWAKVYAPDGDITGLNADNIANICQWDKSAKKLFDALVTCGFLDVIEECAEIHDWNDAQSEKVTGAKSTADNAKKLRRREYQRRYMSEYRKKTHPVNTPVNTPVNSVNTLVNPNVNSVNPLVNPVNSSLKFTEEKNREEKRREEFTEEFTQQFTEEFTKEFTPPPPVNNVNPVNPVYKNVYTDVYTETDASLVPFDGGGGNVGLSQVIQHFEDNISSMPTTSSTVIAEIKNAVERHGSELVIFAIDEAARADSRNWKYINGILNRFINNNITTISQAKNSQAEFESKKNKNKKGEVSLQDYNAQLKKLKSEAQAIEIKKGETQ